MALPPHRDFPLITFIAAIRWCGTMADRRLVGGRRLGKLLPIRPAAVSEVANLFLMHRHRRHHVADGSALSANGRRRRLQRTHEVGYRRRGPSRARHAINANVEKDRWSVETAAQSAIK